MSSTEPGTRARAPTITVDTSNVDDNSPAAPKEITSAYVSPTPGAGSLAVPARIRGDSIDSTSTTGSTAVGSPATPQKSSVIHNVDKPDAFKPIDEKEASLFQEQDPRFPITKGHLAKLNPRKDYVAYYQLKGLLGLAKGLQTDLKKGLSANETKVSTNVSFADVQGVSPSDELQASKEEHGYNTVSEVDEKSTGHDDAAFSDRKHFYGDNRIPARQGKTFLQLCWAALMDKILILLCVAAVISLALGIYQSTRPHDPAEGANIEWVEGVAILVAVIIVVLVGAVNDWQKERQFKKLNAQKEDRLVKVVRSGAVQRVSVWDVFPGDVMCLDQGDVIPVDGIFIEGHNVSCDESSATGESDLLKKSSGHEVWQALHDGQDVRKLDPFIISGARVSEGTGTFLVTAVGVNSSHGMLMLSLAEDDQTTPLQYKLNKLASYIAKLGSSAGLLLFVVLFIEFLAGLGETVDENGLVRTADSKGQDFIDILIQAVTIIVVAVPEGLPLAVTLALAFATKRMTKDKNLVRHLQSCETMGNATVICSDKTGTLTQNVMTVVAAAFGNGSVRCGERAAAAPSSIDGKDDQGSDPQSVIVSEKTDPNGEFPIYDLNKRMNSDLQRVLKDAIAINSTAFESNEDGKTVFQGSKTETALLDFAVRCFGLANLQKEREALTIVQLIPFDSGKKCMGAVVKHQDGYRMYIKGASEIVLSHCTQVLDAPLDSTTTRVLENSDTQALKETISGYAGRSLRTIGLAYRDFQEWPPAGARLAENSRDVVFDDLNKDLIWQGVAAIQDPVRPGVPDSVKTCERAGVRVIMVTGDNVETARAIATECGILKENGTVIAGPEFRTLNPVELAQVLPTLCVIARSSPQDKKYLVENLQSEGHVVAVTGDGTNDAPALKAADVGFSMGITGTEVAKEASDIIIMDDNFGSIVKALAWGRTVNDAVKKFLQFQLTVNVVAVLVTFITAVASGTETSVLKAVQLLWINLIMDTFAALALATDPPSGSVIDRKPEPRNSSLISVTMWKQIIGQSIFQFITVMVLYFGFKDTNTLGQESEVQFNAFIFNTFTWFQIFDAVNSRRIDNKLNILEGITRNYFFVGILAIMAGGQTLIMFVGGAAFGVDRLTGKQWGLSIGIGAITIPIGAALRFIPDAWLAAIGRALYKVLLAMIPSPVKRWWRKRKAAKAAKAADREEPKDGTYWDQVAGRIMDPDDHLGFYTFVRGRRLDRVKTRLQHPKTVFSRSRSGSRSVLPALVAAGAMGASVGGGAISPSTRSVSRASEEPVPV